eukprot:6478560-Amphidinium_carterae.2
MASMGLVAVESVDDEVEVDVEVNAEGVVVGDLCAHSVSAVAHRKLHVDLVLVVTVEVVVGDLGCVDDDGEDGAVESSVRAARCKDWLNMFTHDVIVEGSTLEDARDVASDVVVDAMVERVVKVDDMLDVVDEVYVDAVVDLGARAAGSGARCAASSKLRVLLGQEVLVLRVLERLIETTMLSTMHI